MYALLQNVFVVGDVYASLSSFADASPFPFYFLTQKAALHQDVWG